MYCASQGQPTPDSMLFNCSIINGLDLSMNSKSDQFTEEELSEHRIAGLTSEPHKATRLEYVFDLFLYLLFLELSAL